MTGCAACGFDNPSGAQFCGRCGAPLGAIIACPDCGAPNAPTNSYCNACGRRLREAAPEPLPHPGVWPDRRAFVPETVARKILAARRQLAGERKQVTVLFADVVGSTKLAERSGPEQWRQIIERLFAMVCDGVHRFDGIVDRFTGDGAMAVFGAPLADEHHALHACHAALDLREQVAAFSAQLRREHGLNLLMRIGLNSGEVVVGAIGDDLDIKYSATGHTVALARRMEGLAEPGKVYVTEHTAASARGFFDLRDLGEFDVKGLEAPVNVYELTGLGRLRTELDVARARGLSRFVGRQREMDALASALARASEGSGQVVCIAGEAGVGKSRLLYEFARRCRDDRIEVWEGHCRARGETLALMPLLELLRSYFAIGERDAATTAREKIAGRVLLADASLREELPLLFELLGVADPAQQVERIDPEARQRRLFALLNRILTGRSQQAAIVLVLEDLQWIDPGSAAFLENLIDALPGTHTLVLVSFRPEYQAGWTQRSYCGRVALAPLAASPSRELASDLLGANRSLTGIAERIAERADGNPFFIEELVRGLVNNGSLIGARGAYRLARPVDEQAIPATVQAVIEGRIDRLEEHEKRLLQTAAVIGREFDEAVLSRAAGTSQPEVRLLLRALVAAELIYERTQFPDAGYAFAHELIVDIAYHCQLQAPRAELHAKVANVLEELHPGRLDELAGLISHHLEQAGKPLEAARWGSRAALWAGQADVAGAVRHWRRTSELTEIAPESPEATALGIWSRIALEAFASRLGADSPELRNALERARELAQRSGDARALAFVLGGDGMIRLMAGDLTSAVQLGLEARRLALELGDPATQVSGIGVPLALFYLGRWRQALEVMAPWFELWAEDPTLGSFHTLESPYAACRCQRALIRLWLGELSVEQARAEIAGGLAIALEHHDFENAVGAYAMQVHACFVEGDGDAALELAHQATELAERTGSLYSLHHATYAASEAHLLRGEWTQATAATKNSLEMAGKVAELEPVVLAQLAEALLGGGHAEQARETAKQAVAMAAERHSPYFEVYGQLALARALIGLQATHAGRELDDSARRDIEAPLGRAESLIDELEFNAYRPFLDETRARLAQLAGDAAAYRDELAEAQRQWEAMGAIPRAERIAAELSPVTA